MPTRPDYVARLLPVFLPYQAIEAALTASRVGSGWNVPDPIQPAATLRPSM
jgi:hypothetical protein